MKNIQEKFLWKLEKSFESCTDSHRTIACVFTLFLLGEFLVERKYHVIKVNHEIKYPEKVAVYTCNN